MKNRLLNSFFRAAAAFALLLAAGACKDDVALPMQRVALNTHAILAPSFATTLSFDVEANCDWTISVAGDDTSWAELSQTEATGMATVAVSIAENNTSGSRALTIRVAAKRNAAVVEELSFVQASATAEGYLSIPDLRKLAADGDYSVTQDVKMRGIVVSSVQDNNYYDNCIALQSALKANCGITLRTDEVLYRKPGEELEIDLKGAVVGVNPETGVMEVKPAADDKVSRTETTQVKIEALKITYEELRSGAYESMYAGIYSQVYVPEGGSLNGITLKDDLSMQDPDNNRFRLVASQASSFGIDPAPTGSGVLKGIVVPQDGAYAIRPCTAGDKELTGLRFGAQVGIRLPYVFSFYAASQANKDCKYVTVTDGTFDKLGADFKVEDKDVTKCVVLTAKVAPTSNSRCGSTPPCGRSSISVTRILRSKATTRGRRSRLPCRSEAPERPLKVETDMISIIVAVAENGIIGDNNRLLWHISEDLRRFKRITTGHPVVMGRKTWDSLGRPLPGRKNVVVTRRELSFDGAQTVHSLDEAYALFPPEEEVFVIGGAQIYGEALPAADRFYLTRVHRAYEGDTRFPEWDAAEWRLVGSESFPCGERYEYPFTFETYERKR